MRGGVRGEELWAGGPRGSLSGEGRGGDRFGLGLRCWALNPRLASPRLFPRSLLPREPLCLQGKGVCTGFELSGAGAASMGDRAHALHGVHTTKQEVGQIFRYLGIDN